MNEKFLQPGGFWALKNVGISFKTGVGEILDNSIEEGATEIVILLRKKEDGIYELFIIDNGNGMDKQTLQIALTFGGEDHGVNEKALNDVGKYHVGMPLTMIRFSPISTVYTKKINAPTYMAQFSLDKLMQKGEIETPIEIKKAPNEVDELQPHFDFASCGTTIVFNELYPDLINEQNIDVEIQQLEEYISERYFIPLEQKKVSIYLKVQDAGELEEIVPASPLLNNEKLLEEHGLALMGHYLYKDILRVKELRPNAVTDGSLSIEFTIIQKINNSYNANKVPKLFALNQVNQGIYITRNWKLLNSALDIGFKKHNSLNGMRALIRVNAAFDELLGIELNKSDHKITAEFEHELGERIKDVIKHLRKMLNPKLTFFEDPPTTIVGKEQRVIKPEILKSYSLKMSPVEEDDVKERDIEPARSFSYLDTPSLQRKKATVPIQKHSIIFAVLHEMNFNKNFANNCEMVRDDYSYLIYNEPLHLQTGITYSQLKHWWQKLGYQDIQLYEERIHHTLIAKATSAHLLFYDLYAQYFLNKPIEKYVLFPKVSVTQHVEDSKKFVDFFIQLPNDRKVVIEIDSIEHYAEKKNKVWHASEPLYTSERKFDRQLMLKGYAVYRFTDLELQQPTFKQQLFVFLDELFESVK